MNHPFYEYRRVKNRHQIFEAEAGCVASFMVDEISLDQIKGFCLMMEWNVGNWPRERES